MLLLYNICLYWYVDTYIHIIIFLCAGQKTEDVSVLESGKDYWKIWKLGTGFSCRNATMHVIRYMHIRMHIFYNQHD